MMGSKDIIGEANRANLSFYAIDPRFDGLTRSHLAIARAAR